MTLQVLSLNDSRAKMILHDLCFIVLLSQIKQSTSSITTQYYYKINKFIIND